MPRSRYRPILPANEARLMTDMNTTPLIDVLLVLLIMMILTVPIVTHKVAIDIPAGAPSNANIVAHRLEITASGSLLWDGASMSREFLPGTLRVMKADAAQPVLHIRADGEAPYGIVDMTLADVKRAGIEKIGLIDNGRFADVR